MKETSHISASRYCGSREVTAAVRSVSLLANRRVRSDPSPRPAVHPTNDLVAAAELHARAARRRGSLVWRAASVVHRQTHAAYRFSANLHVIRTKFVRLWSLFVDSARCCQHGCLHARWLRSMNACRYRIARWWRRLGPEIAGRRLQNMSPRE